MILEPITGAADDFRVALTAADLPVDDLSEPGRIFFRFMEGENIVAYGGYELYGEHALLRSIVVLPETRGTGLGTRATDMLLREIAGAGGKAAYLLTTSASTFFERIGFRPIARESAPGAILATRQVSALCPSTAALMARAI